MFYIIGYNIKYLIVNMAFVLVIILNLCFVKYISKKYLKNNDFGGYYKYNIFFSIFTICVNYISIIISAPINFYLYFVTPMTMGRILKKHPNFLFNYSDDQKFYFIIIGMLLIIFIWELLITIIYMKFILNIIKTYNKHNNEKLSKIKYMILSLLPIINIIIPFKFNKLIMKNNA
jgi:hypothetical protein